MVPRQSRYSLILALALTAVLLAPGAARAQNPQSCSATVNASLAMHTMFDGMMTIPVTIQKRNFYFLVDTGGVFSMIDPGVAQSLALRQDAAAPIQGAAGVVLNHTVTPQDFSIGNIGVSGQRLYVAQGGVPFEGTIAYDVLKNYDVEFDFAGGIFKLMTPGQCPGAAVNWTKNAAIAVIPISIGPTGRIQFPVTIDGKTVPAFVDTGAQASTMSLSFASSHLGVAPNAAGLKAVNPNTPGARYSYPFKTLSFQSVTAQDPQIDIFPDSFLTGLGDKMIIGANLLRQFHVYISYGEKKMYVTTALAR